MRILFVTILGLSLFSSVSFSQEKQTLDLDFTNNNKDTDPKPETFKEAYSGYLEYEESEKYDDLHLKVLFAEKAYEFGLRKFGKKNINTANLMINWINSFIQHSNNHKYPFLYSKELNSIKKFLTEEDMKYYYTEIGTIQSRPFEYKTSYNGISLLNKALRIVKNNVGENTKEYTLLLVKKASAQYFMRDKADSIRTIIRAKEALLNVKENIEPEMALVNFWHAKSLLAYNKFSKAENTMKDALTTLENNTPKSDLTLSAHAFMVETLEQQGKSIEANKHCQAIGRVKPFDINRQPKPIFQRPLDFPVKALNTRENGKVVLNFTIDKNGIVKNPKVIKSLGHKAFVDMSLNTLSSYRFAPRFKNGIPVDTDGLTYTFNFKISN